MKLYSLLVWAIWAAYLCVWVGRAAKNAAEIRDPKLRKVYELIYPYYQRPRYRYPFYDHYGNGELLYGYGGRKLYKYTVFKPVEGYLRK